MKATSEGGKDIINLLQFTGSLPVTLLKITLSLEYCMNFSKRSAFITVNSTNAIFKRRMALIYFAYFKSGTTLQSQSYN